jgi:enediyne biosynthesis protein E4
MNRGRWTWLIFIFILNACNEKHSKYERGETLFTQLDSKNTGVSFRNEVVNKEDFNIFRYRNLYNGGGVAIGDINNDGLPDIFFTANMQQNRLYLNRGDFKFEEITESAGVAGVKPWHTGVVMVDINGDGLLDIYVSNAGNLEGNNHDNDLYINNGDLTFTERAREFNLARSGFSTHASFFDYDKDGDLDAYILNNSNVPVSSLGYASDRTKRADEWDNIPKKLRGVGHMLLRNDNNKFVDVSEEAGIYGSLIAFGLGVMVCDINEDTYPDIYVSNDFYERDYLYVNNQNGTFTEDIKNWTSHLCLSAMGVDIADINNDGLKDIFVTDMMPDSISRTKKVMEFDNNDVFRLKQERDFYQQYIQNTLQLNNGNSSFSEIAYFSGVAKTDWSWAGLIFDMDNDGFKDIYVTNGIIHDLTDIDFVDFLANDVIRTMVLSGSKSEMLSVINKMPSTPLSNYAFRNNHDLTFQNVAQAWGLSEPSFSNGCAYGDLDNDGDLDLVVNNVNMEAFIFRNESEKFGNNYLQFQLKGDGLNQFAVGSTIKIFKNKQILVQDLMPSRGFQSSMDYVLTFGVGKSITVDSIHILWPNNKLTVLKETSVNQRIFLKQSEANFMYQPKKKPVDVLFKKVDNVLTSHIEDNFDDFDKEGLLYRYLSKEGPACAVGDVNGDGNDDVFIGGAKGQPGVLYLHADGGKLKEYKSDCFIRSAEYEDTAAAFFDADNDGDLDLIVGTGGNNADDKDGYVTQLYINDGAGRFSASTNSIPTTKSNVSIIAPQDFDMDGDIDLFVGYRNIPGLYGISPKHLLLINDGSGNFTDGTERYAFDLRNSGMVTDAKWADMDGDNKSDLITVSDWGSPKIYKNSGTGLIKVNSNLDSLLGWWNVIETIDIDKDGRLDFLLGNAGLNIPFVGTSDSPVKLWVNDFDQNGTIEQIMTIGNSNGDYPIHMRRELTAQIPSLKKQNLKATDYSKRTIQQLFKEDIVAKSLILVSNNSNSIIAKNLGNGKFKIEVLPQPVQWSNVSSIASMHIDGDTITDIIMGGNNFDFKPQFSRQDASGGHVLLGNGYDLVLQNYSESGFFIRDPIKHLLPFRDKKGNTYLLVAINNREPQVFKPTR